MDIREMLEKCKPFAPVVSAAVVAACVAGSLYGYKVPVYETKASVEDTQEQEDPLIWKMVCIRGVEPDIGEISQ
mgnify:CR=1 FL=1